MVGAGTLHASAAILNTTPEIAAADNNADLAANVCAALNYVTNRADHVKIQAEVLVTGKRFPADLDEDAFILGSIHVLSSC